MFFIQVMFLHFLTFFKYFFPHFLFKKMLSKAKYEYAKIQRETLLAMIFIDFGLLHSQYCKISYLLNSADVTQIIVGLVANFGKDFTSNVHKRF